MLHHILRKKVSAWFNTDECTMREVVSYIRKKGELRLPQIEAIETYLYLKIVGENKPLYQLFSEGVFNAELDLDKLNINTSAREFLQENKTAYALYNYAHQQSQTEIQEIIARDKESIDYEDVVRSIFYGVRYPDYLMSLPMGAGKTYLMAALIYLELYLAEMNPNDKDLAQNFLILIPNAQKSSIGPSLQTIDKFQPDWVLPPDLADRIESNIRFSVLDESKSASKSMRTKNRNASKVMQAMRFDYNNIFVVNAEKVILNKIVDERMSLHLDEKDEDMRANELRATIGKLPNLAIFIDEVHHATDSDIKLRRVVNDWCGQKDSQIVTVLGFSGTPYLDKKDTITVKEGAVFRLPQISNTVYYYPLLEGVRTFLKRPEIKIADELTGLEIIRRGVEEFQEKYADTVYQETGIAKLAIYSPRIQVLEEEVYPFLVGELGIPDSEILRYHGGNKDFPQSAKSKEHFSSLDLPTSPHRYILLVQIGKEGWDCRSLTGVILSQEGSCPKNMVLQTCCRCLRQAERKDEQESLALIWLNKPNAALLSSQLKKQQATSIEEIQNIDETSEGDIEQQSRIEYLKLKEKIKFYQLKINFSKKDIEPDPNTDKKLHDLIDTIKRRSPEVSRLGSVTGTGLDNINEGVREHINKMGDRFAVFSHWLLQLSKESFRIVTLKDLEEHTQALRKIFNLITYKKDKALLWNEFYLLENINSRIRLCFHRRRDLETREEVIPQDIELLRVEKLGSVAKDSKLFPSSGKEVEEIIKLDRKGKSANDAQKELDEARALLRKMGKDPDLIPPQERQSLAVENKEKTLHYLPYDFMQGGGLEERLLKEVLRSKFFLDKGLEIYYTGTRGLTEFVIDCYIKRGNTWNSLGHYTTDFLIIKRKNSKLHKIMLLETKGEVYAHKFADKKEYLSDKFIRNNNEKFGYRRFDFLYLEDTKSMSENLNKLGRRIADFFTDS